MAAGRREMINVKVTIGVQFKESDIKENSGRDYITKEDVEEYIADRYSEGLGCDAQILSSDEPIIEGE